MHISIKTKKKTIYLESEKLIIGILAYFLYFNNGEYIRNKRPLRSLVKS